MHGTRGLVLSPFEPPSENSSSLPSTPSIGYYDGRWGESETGQYRSQMVRFRVIESLTKTNRLTSDSIQEALRTYFQPIQNDDPQLDFYAMYRRETMEYDIEYMNKHSEDLNITLIFVRVWISSVAMC